MRVEPDTPTSITISGSGFAEATAVRLSYSLDRSVPVDFTVVSDRTIRATVTVLANSRPGITVIAGSAQSESNEFSQIDSRPLSDPGSSIRTTAQCRFAGRTFIARLDATVSRRSGFFAFAGDSVSLSPFKAELSLPKASLLSAADGQSTPFGLLTSAPLDVTGTDQPTVPFYDSEAILVAVPRSVDDNPVVLSFETLGWSIVTSPSKSGPVTVSLASFSIALFNGEQEDLVCTPEPQTAPLVSFTTRPAPTMSPTSGPYQGGTTVSRHGLRLRGGHDDRHRRWSAGDGDGGVAQRTHLRHASACQRAASVQVGRPGAPSISLGFTYIGSSPRGQLTNTTTANCYVPDLGRLQAPATVTVTSGPLSVEPGEPVRTEYATVDIALARPRRG